MSEEDKRLHTLAKQTLDETLGWYPGWGTHLGLHEYDSLMPDGRRETHVKHIGRMEEFREEFESIDEEALSEENKLERLLALTGLDLELFNYEELRFWDSAPTGVGVVGDHVLSLFMRDFAPLQVRLRNITRRLEASPKYLEQAKSLVSDPVKIWTQNQLESAQRFPRFLDLISRTAEDVLGKDHINELQESIEATRVSTDDYASWMKDLLPEAREEFAMGAERFARLLELSSIDMPVPDILALGKGYLEQYKQAASEIAKEIDPEATVDEVMERVKSNHPEDFGAAFELYEDSIHQVRDFVANMGIATLPESESLKVMETPAFMRHIIPHAAYFSPGKFERHQQGIYLVTPIEENEEMMREHNYAVIGNTSVHEAYPGHHLQLVCANTHPSLIRVMTGARETVEGWAHYCEEMMKEHGFEDSPESKYMQTIDLIWRAARIIVDVDLSTGEMGFDEAVKFLMDEVGMEEAFALAEVKRYTRAQGYQLCYLLGKHLISELRNDIRKRMGNDYTERFFHDTILYAGSIPVKFLRMEFDHRLKKMGL